MSTRHIVPTLGFLLSTTLLASATVLRVPTQYPTIQQAVHAAQRGDRIKISEGIYNEYVSIDNRENLTLIGKGRVRLVHMRIEGSTDITVRRLQFSSDGSLSFLGSSNVTVRNCQFLGSSIGGAQLTLRDCERPTVRKCEFLNHGNGLHPALFMDRGRHAIIEDCRFVNCDTPVRLLHTQNIGYSDGVTQISRCTIRGGALSMYNAPFTTLTENRLVDASIGMEKCSGSKLYKNRLAGCDTSFPMAVAISDSSRVTLWRNRLMRSAGIGFYLRGVSGSTVRGNRVKNSRSTGLRLENSANVTVLNNRVRHSGDVDIMDTAYSMNNYEGNRYDTSRFN